ncbi:zinc-coordinating transcription factor SFP1 Ecym_3253 [Eremothecium cymbalariae DBVPG|uniref:C2H2-type domain-containing protein n=1 Tax=Eremothecium cymbalariae (strain CBS 270.75 / DBVPG 7215 / KCTC 17166 / NRRL Y-17582) TaxID=931890 RepID=G8JRH7_ERECY|nr:Hypothetical protein Ecym_3253 [Eremothecium cymbalariae DBVPG\
MEVTTATSATPSIYISEAQQGLQPNGGHQPHQSQHHLNTQQHQHQMAKFRRESIAHSQGMGGVSWGSLTVGSWLKEEVMIHAHMKDTFNNNIASNNMASFASPPSSSGSYLPNLEKKYCKDYSCCGQLLPSLHDLLRHYEEAHIATSPGHHVSIAGGSGNLTGNMGAAATQNPSVNTRKMGVLAHQQPQHPHQQQHPHGSSSGHQQTSVQQAHQLQHSHVQAHHYTQPHYNNGNVHSSPLLQQQMQLPNHHHQALAPAGGPMQAQASMPSSQQQLHLNGNLVDAVCTNDVFLQTNNVATNAPSITHIPDPSSGLGAQPGSKLGMVSGERSNSSNTQQPKGGRRQLQQHQQQAQQMNFNTYSLQMNTSKHNSGMSNLQQQNQSRLVQKRSATNSVTGGVDLDFMDQDMIDAFNPENSSAMVGIQNLGSMVDRTSVVGGSTILNQQSGPVVAGITKKKQCRSINGSSEASGVAGSLSNKRTHGGPLTAGNSRHAISSDDEDDDDDDDDQDDDQDDDEHVGKSKKQGYIDDPARRLYVMDHEEHKPFKCPVIGCDKTYKNQNGLKYHKTHGHQNQKLHENPDGTFSIIDPESNEPYPDGMGFEKDKPYRCEVCGKRYKNLNGLKYHRGHSTH